MASKNPNLPIARPFVKWAGGKQRVLPHLLSRLPGRRHSTYHEPFVGGGAMFFCLAARYIKNPGWHAHLSDQNERLVRTYSAIKRDVDGVIARLQEHASRHDEKYYYEVRGQQVDDFATDAQVAAWFIYLNKTCFNGLYRVNKKNIFNVPIGRYINPTICDADNLRACAGLLARAEIHHEPYDVVRDRAQPGDFVYFDPPYVPLSSSANFTAYTQAGFGLDDQQRLRDLALALKERGVDIMLSNHGNEVVRELYQRGFDIQPIAVARAINSRGSNRGHVEELVIC